MIGAAESTSLGAFLDSRRSSAPAIIHDGRTESYGELADGSRRLAQGLRELGVGAGDRVGIWLPNIPEWLMLYFACARVAAVAVAINTRFRSSEVQDIVGRSGCKVLALWPEFKNIDFAGILAGIDPAALRALETVLVCGGSASHPLPDRRTVQLDALLCSESADSDSGTPDSPCTIFTTSGTTGAPKFVLHSQGGITQHAQEAARAHGYTAADACLLQILPFCGTFGLTQAMATLAARRSMVLQTVFDAAEAVALGQRYGVTHFNASDEMVARMLDASDVAQPLPALQFCGYARFAGISGLVERAAARGVHMRGLYGMSECQALFALQPAHDPEHSPLPGGIPASPAAQVRVCDPDSGAVLAHGEAGEIQVRGPSLMLAYDGDAAATAAAFTEDGFFRTGDIGYSTPGGGFVFTSRAGDVLRLGGFLVAPAEIERYLELHPAVRTSAVVAGPTPGTCVAFVEASASVTEQALHDFCRTGLARFKVPARIYLLDALPSVPSPNGAKIRRNLLRDWAQEWGQQKTS
jgi:fatty-acyl-CoA synthase